MKALIIIGLSFFCLYCSAVSGQENSINRQTIIKMVLDQSRIKTNSENNSPTAKKFTLNPPAQVSSQCFRTVNTIPKYCLAKGAVICRLEEYVQLHSPFKLNIGVGGE